VNSPLHQSAGSACAALHHVADRPIFSAHPPRQLHPTPSPALQTRADCAKSALSARRRQAYSKVVFYLHAPDGIGRSKLAASAERLLGVPLTARNWRTICKIKDLAEALPP